MKDNKPVSVKYALSNKPPQWANTVGISPETILNCVHDGPER
jgi:hypothetical protein